MLKIDIGGRLRLLRNLCEWKQWEVAKMLNISRSTYAYYETGKTRPDYETLASVASLYGVSVDFLLGLSRQPPDKGSLFYKRFAELFDAQYTELKKYLEDLE